ncbi:MAG: hypothetical protein HUU37_07075, partial [Bdellovibrionales bacterium]|nr:hypothetical protein [Bdellovibrionales bacterium]
SPMTSLLLGVLLLCEVREAGDLVMERRVSVGDRATVDVGEAGALRMKVSHRGGSVFEVEVFDPSLPARSYAEGTLREMGDRVTWSFWSRDALRSAGCRRL